MTCCHLVDCSTYQLRLDMNNGDWRWLFWVVPRQRANKNTMNVIPVGYRPGEAKLYYSTAIIIGAYLMALLES